MTTEETLQQQQQQTQQVAPSYPQFNSAADIDAYFTRQQEAAYERQRQREEERLRKQQVAQAMGDLGHVLVDTIKASGGALVTPRDVTARYQQMDERSQKIYDNYIARMDAIRNRQYATAQADLARKQRLDDLEADRRFRSEEAEKDRLWREAQEQNKLEAAAKQAELDRKSKENIAYSGIAAKKEVAQQRYNNYYDKVVIGKYDFHYPRRMKNQVYDSIYAWMKTYKKIDPSEVMEKDEWGSYSKLPKRGDIERVCNEKIALLPEDEKKALFDFLDNKGFDLSIPDSVTTDNDDYDFGGLI